MRILVIGGNGFIGTPLVRELLARGHKVAVLHRTAGKSANLNTVQLRGDRNRLPEHTKDLRRFAPQIIIDMILSSRDQSQQLVAVATDLDARVIAISSMDVYRAWGVYLGTEQGELEPLPITEDSPLHGPRTYPEEIVETLKAIFTWVNAGYDKVAVEHTVMSGRPASTVIRLPMVYGPGDPLHRMHGLLKRIGDGRPTVILGDDHAAWRGPRGYVENVAHAIALAATLERASGRIFHVCEEPSVTELEWQKRIAAQTAWKGKFVVLPKERVPKHLSLPVNASQHLVADSERIRKELGYEEPVPIDEAIQRTIAWEEHHPPGGPTFHRFDYAAEDEALVNRG